MSAMNRSFALGLLIAAAGQLAQADEETLSRFVLFGGGFKDLPEGARQVTHPISSPYGHEDSYVTSDIRAWYLHHSVDDDTLGGEIQVGALQVRLALTERLQLVAYKDGYTRMNFDGDALDGEGWNDVAAGLKYKFLEDWDYDIHAAVGVGYEFRVGESDVLQNDDELRVWGSLNKGFGDLHLGATVNYFRAMDEDEGPFGSADRLSWSLHADYRICKWFSPVLELNGYHVVDEGPGALPFHGVDAVNPSGGESEPVVTGAVGFEARPLNHLALRFAYETDLTDNVDIFDDRYTVSAVLSF